MVAARRACALFVMLLPELLALSAAPVRRQLRSTACPDGRALCGFVVRCGQALPMPRLRGGDGSNEEGKSTESDGSGANGDSEKNAEIDLSAEMHKAAELIERVKMELGDAESVVQEKQALNVTCDELHVSKENAEQQLGKHTAALLIAAAKSGDTPSVQEALDNGASVNTVDDDGAK